MPIDCSFRPTRTQSPSPCSSRIFPAENCVQPNSPSRLRPHRRSCCFVRLVDVRHATSSTFKDKKVGQAPKSRRCSSEPHNLSAAWANRRPWRVFTRVFVAHGRKRSLNRNVVRSRPAAALAHQCGNGELTNEQKNWYRIRVHGDDRHREFAFMVTTITGTYTQGVLVLYESGVAFREECSHEVIAN